MVNKHFIILIRVHISGYIAHYNLCNKVYTGISSNKSYIAHYNSCNKVYIYSWIYLLSTVLQPQFHNVIKST